MIKKIGAIALILTCILIALSVGNVNIGLDKIADIFMGRANNSEALIILQLRLPRIINCVVAGAGLSISGVILQTILKNSLAEPYILGISSGAALGAVIGITTNNFVMVSLLAFIFSVGVVTVVYLISSNKGEVNAVRIILTGVIANSFIASIIMLIVTFSSGKIRDIVFWTMGDLGNISMGKLFFLSIVIIISLIIIYIFGNELDLLALNEESAFYSGVNTKFIKGLFFVISALITSVIVSSSGIIGFVGIIVPHIVKMVIGRNHKEIIFFSGVLGSLFLLTCDTIGRSVVNNMEIPVGVVTAIIGAPVFIMILKKNGDKI